MCGRKVLRPLLPPSLLPSPLRFIVPPTFLLHVHRFFFLFPTTSITITTTTITITTTTTSTVTKTTTSITITTTTVVTINSTPLLLREALLSPPPLFQTQPLPQLRWLHAWGSRRGKLAMGVRSTSNLVIPHTQVNNLSCVN